VSTAKIPSSACRLTRNRKPSTIDRTLGRSAFAVGAKRGRSASATNDAAYVTRSIA